jgi:DNA processing protein
MLSQQTKLILALTCLPRVGRQVVRSILSNIELAESLNESCFNAVLSKNNVTSIVDFINGTGALVNKIDSIECALQEHHISLSSYLDTDYPGLLHEIPDAPLLLFYKGNFSVLNLDQIAIVGSRKASPSGLRHAYKLADDLLLNGFAVTSGLAHGVDSAAHCAAVDRALPTIAVMGTGLDIIYPKQNTKLAHAILEQGCWVSEYFPGSAPRAVNFPRRNRIISGLSLGVLVVEARPKSGTLITARMAIEQNRDVFAIPGSIDFLGSHGCHQLIADGAKLVQTVEDILQEYPDRAHSIIANLMTDPAVNNQHSAANEQPINAMAAAVLCCVDDSAQTLEQIALLAKIRVDVLSTVMVELELLGLVENINGGFVRR